MGQYFSVALRDYHSHFDPARENIAAKARLRSSPSTEAVTAVRRDMQHRRRLDAVHNFRPLELSTPPITIYHPVFAQFLQLMEEEPTDFKPEELTRAQYFVAAATDFYRTADKRVDALTDMVRAHANGVEDNVRAHVAKAGK